MATCVTCGLDPQEIHDHVERLERVSRELDQKLALLEALLEACKKYQEKGKLGGTA